MKNLYKYFNIELIRLKRKGSIVFIALIFIFFFLFIWLRASDIIGPNSANLSENILFYLGNVLSLSDIYGFFLAIWVSYDVISLFKEKLLESFLLHGYSRNDLGIQVFSLVLVRVVIVQFLIILGILFVGLIYNQNLLTYLNLPSFLVEMQSLLLISLFTALFSIIIPSFLMIFFIPLYFILEDYFVYTFKRDYNFFFMEYAPINVFHKIKEFDSIFYMSWNTIFPVLYFILIVVLIHSILLKKRI